MQLAGPYAFGPPPDRASAIGVLWAAVAAGADHIDTAHYYGPGTIPARPAGVRAGGSAGPRDGLGRAGSADWVQDPAARAIAATTDPATRLAARRAAGWAHTAVVEHSGGSVERVPLTPDRAVAAVTGDVLAAVARVAGPVAIDPRPQKVPWSVPLDEDHEHARYDPGQVRDYFAAATHGQATCL